MDADMEPLSDADRALIETAEEALSTHYAPGVHTTAAAVRTASDAVYTAVSLKANTSSADVHAEPVAVARAKLDGETAFETVAAVQYRDAEAGTFRVVSACGVCRELLLEQAPGLSIVVDRDDARGKRPIADMLPD